MVGADATFIVAPPGKTNSEEDRGRGQPSTRNEDGTWAEEQQKFNKLQNHDQVQFEARVLKAFHGVMAVNVNVN